jgi:hypothetical protein
MTRISAPVGTGSGSGSGSGSGGDSIGLDNILNYLNDLETIFMSSISSTQIPSLNKQFKQLNIRNVDIEKIYESSIYSPYSDGQQIIFSKMYDNRIYLANGFYLYNIANGLEKDNFINAVFLRSNKGIVLGKNNFYKFIQFGATDTNISTSYPAKIIGTRNLSDIFYEIHLDGTIIKVNSGNSGWDYMPVTGSRKQLLGKKVYNNLIFQGFKDNELFFINKTENNIFELIKLTNAGEGNSGFEMPSDLIEVIVPDLGLYNLNTSDINNIKHILAVPFYGGVDVQRVYILFKNGLLKYLRLNGDTTVRMVEDKVYSIAYRNDFTISYFNAETFQVKDFNIIQEISYSNLNNIRLMDRNGICVRVAPGASIGGSLIDEFLYGSGSSGSSGSGIGTNNVDLFLSGSGGGSGSGSGSGSSSGGPIGISLIDLFLLAPLFGPANIGYFDPSRSVSSRDIFLYTHFGHGAPILMIQKSLERYIIDPGGNGLSNAENPLTAQIDYDSYNLPINGWVDADDNPAEFSLTNIPVEDWVVILGTANGWYNNAYWINNVKTTLNQNGSGTWNGQNYTNGILDS